MIPCRASLINDPGFFVTILHPSKALYSLFKSCYMPIEQVRPVPVEFTKQGFRYKQIRRVGNLAIYEQRLIKSKAVYYEVWVIRIRKERTIKDTVLPKSEKMPSPEDWGRYAWTFYTRTSAESRLDQLLKLGKHATEKKLRELPPPKPHHFL
jgi:hypothetical protein